MRRGDASARIASWQARVARRERAIAERRFNDVRQLANSLLFKYHNAIEKLPGSTDVRRMLITDALRYLDALAREASGDPSLQRELATAYLKVGDIQGKPFAANLGDTAGALESYRRAQLILAGLAESAPSNAEALALLSLAYENVGLVLERMTDTEQAAEMHRRALDIRERLRRDNPANATLRRQIATSYLYLGDALRTAGTVKTRLGREGAEEYLLQAGENYSKALAMREELAAASPADTESQRELAQALQRAGFTHNSLGAINSEPGDFQLALEYFSRALKIRQRLLAADPANAQHRRRLAGEYQNLGDPQMMLGDAGAALKNYREALSMFESLASADATNAEARRDIAHTHLRIARALSQSGEESAALTHYRRCAQLYEKMIAADPTRFEDRMGIHELHLETGALLERRNETAAAIESYRQAAAHLAQALEASAQLKMPAHLDDAFRRRLDETYSLLATKIKSEGSP
ncbi:MAG: hypothetical protein ACR2G4_06240 [Pyrinomonadaceae bacterium]